MAIKYLNRIVDSYLNLLMEAFGATLIVGPKGCGKTTTARQKAQSIIEFQDEEKRENYILLAQNNPSRLLNGEKPILFDEWQDAPKIWGAIRKNIDDSGLNGQYILTGSTSSDVETPHTGTLRIAKLKMLPMSLYESGESNGKISLSSLFDKKEVDENNWESDLSIDDLVFAICRGGWPRAINNKSKEAKLIVARELLQQTADVDISRIDRKRKNPILAQALLRSYARNICQPTKLKNIHDDIKNDTSVSDKTFFEYIEALQKLFIIDDINAWCPAIRSKTAIRASKKRNFIDPSLAVAALGINPNYFDKDYKTFGFLFESLVIRDLKVYSSANHGSVSYYRDRYGLEADAVLHLEDGRYALIEIKLGQSDIEYGAKHLLDIENLIKKHNENEQQVSIRPPDLKIVITGTKYGYIRDDGVYIIPIGCLKD